MNWWLKSYRSNSNWRLVASCCRYTPSTRAYRSYTTIPSNSDQVISTILDLSHVSPNANYQDIKPTGVTPLESLVSMGMPPPRSFKFTGALEFQPLTEETKSKVTIYGVANDIYIDESYKLGQQVIQLIPSLHRTFYSPYFDKSLHKSFEESVKVCEVPSTFQSDFKSLDTGKTLTIQHLIGLNFIQDPKKCLEMMLQSVECEDQVIDGPVGINSFLGDILSSFKEEPIIKLNPEYIFHQGNQFTLPPLQDTSEVVPKLLLNSSFSKELVTPELHGYLDSMSQAGNALYRALIKSSILKCSYGQHINELYYLLINQNYPKFLLERIGIYGQLIDPSPMQDTLTINNSGDLYHRQFGQYVSVLSMNQMDGLISWVYDHVNNYNEIFESMNHKDIKQFCKKFSVYLNTYDTFVDKLKLDRMKEIIKAVQVPIVRDSKVEQETSIAIAKDYISYTAYKLGVIHRYETANKNQILVMKVFNDELLADLGYFLFTNNDEAVDFIKTLLSQLLSIELRQLNVHLIIGEVPRSIGKQQHPFTQSPAINAMMTLSTVNYHVSTNYFRNKGIKSREKNSDFLKKVGQIGYAFYRYNVQLWALQKGLEAPEFQTLFTSKVFKSFVYHRLQLSSLKDGQYVDLLQNRAANKYLKLTIGKTGFDQIIGAMTLTSNIDTKHVLRWIENCINSETVESIPDLLKAQLRQADQQHPEVSTKLKSFDSGLQSFYNQ